MPLLNFEGADGRADHLEYNLYEPVGGSWGTLVVYLHGLLADQNGEKATFLRQRVLAGGCAYATFDFRGHGRSSRALRELTPSGLLEDVTAVVGRVARPGRRLVLVGSSLGGWAAAWFTVRGTAPVDACFLIAPSFRLLQRLADALSPEEREAWRSAGSRVFRGPYGEYELGAQVLEDVTAYRFEDLAAAYCTPTFIVHGMRDESVPWEQSLEFASKTAKADVECLVLNDGDHRLTTHKERLAAALLGFLRQRKLLPGAAEEQGA
ncbi:MAG: alpha/beta hydrolase [Planctomycetes bacterium]|nr:alpha/beta hydrolase [Planctomycetota bacterium]